MDRFRFLTLLGTSGFVTARSSETAALCAAAPLHCPVDAINILETRDGQLIDMGSRQRYRARLDAALESCTNDRPFVIHVHGGLVDAPAAIESARQLAPAYVEAGGTPLFPVYHTGPLESLERSDNERGLLQRGDPQSVAVLNRYSESARLGRARRVGDDRELVSRENWMRAGLPPMSLVGYHGALAWEYMKRAIRDDFDLTPANAYCSSPVPDRPDCPRDVWAHLVRNGYSRERAGGVLLVDALVNRFRQAPPLRVVVVAHSAGSIYATQLLRKFHAIAPPGLQGTLDIAFLAPAVSYTDFSQMLSEGAGRRIRQFRMYTMSEAAERADPVLSSVLGKSFTPALRYYRRSLLYLISNVFEPDPDTPILGLRAFHGSEGSGYDACSANALRTVNAFLRSRDVSVLLTPNLDKRPGRGSASKDHSDFVNFDRDPQMRENYKYLVESSTWA